MRNVNVAVDLEEASFDAPRQEVLQQALALLLPVGCSMNSIVPSSLYVFVYAHPAWFLSCDKNERAKSQKR